MFITTPELKLDPPITDVPLGRGFYQLEEESLYLPVEYPGEQKRFYSYLDSKKVSLHLDRDGRLLFVEISLPRRRWEVIDNFVPPERAGSTRARFINFRQIMNEPAIFCDYNRENILIIFGQRPASQNVYLAENIIGQISTDGYLTALWATDFTDDIAGRAISAWRRSVHGKRFSLLRTA